MAPPTFKKDGVSAEMEQKVVHDCAHTHIMMCVCVYLCVCVYVRVSTCV